jgi:hypothetical protein
MNHIRWVGWGVIDIDNQEAFDRMQRRNFIKRMRSDLEPFGVALHAGGSTVNPWYSIEIGVGTALRSRLPKGDDKPIKHAAGGKDALKKVCAWFLDTIGEHEHVGGTDGSVRSAGAEAEGTGP